MHLEGDLRDEAELQELGIRWLNEVASWAVNFTADAIAEIEDLLEVNRDFCKKEVGKPKGFQVCRKVGTPEGSKSAEGRPTN